jgi:hypothetical protein
MEWSVFSHKLLKKNIVCVFVFTSMRHLKLKVIGALECLSAILFIGFFFYKGTEFKHTTKWKPIANIDSTRELDRNELVFTPREVRQVFQSFNIEEDQANKFLEYECSDPAGIVTYKVLLKRLRSIKRRKVEIYKVHTPHYETQLLQAHTQFSFFSLFCYMYFLIIIY